MTQQQQGGFSTTRTLFLVFICASLALYFSAPDSNSSSSFLSPSSSSSSSSSSSTFFSLWSDDRLRSSTIVRGAIFFLEQPTTTISSSNNNIVENEENPQSQQQQQEIPVSNDVSLSQTYLCIEKLKHSKIFSSHLFLPDFPSSQTYSLFQKQFGKNWSNDFEKHYLKVLRNDLKKKSIITSKENQQQENQVVEEQDEEEIEKQEQTRKQAELLDYLHEQYVVKIWLQAEKEFYRDSKYIRAIGACALGGGLGLDKPHSETHWAERAGATNEHPFFFPLHGGVSPRRVLRHALRCSEYLGIPSEPARFLENHRMLNFFGKRMKKNIDVSSNEILEINDVGISSTAQSNSGNSIERSIRALELEEKQQKKQQKHEQQQQSPPSPELLLDPVDFNPRVVVDLGCGHGAMLAAMCPPHPKLWCYGVDFTDALIKKGKRAFPHLDLRTGVAAPHVPTGTADSVLSNGVTGVIRFSHNCQHFEEILRLLKPKNKKGGVSGGVAIIWHLSSTRWARFHPSLFSGNVDGFYHFPVAGFETNNNTTSNKNKNIKISENDKEFIPNWGKVVVDPSFDPFEDGGGNNNKQQKILKVSAQQVLSRCPNNLFQYIDRIDIIAEDHHAPIYTPSWNPEPSSLSVKSWAGTFGVRIFRNEKKYQKKKREKKGSENSLSLLYPPEGLDLMFASKIWKRERKKYKNAFEVALKCEFFARRGSSFKSLQQDQQQSSKTGWCPESRVMMN